jgi:tetratricopeptide (TPR) repeat protein/TolB-like protein
MNRERLAELFEQGLAIPPGQRAAFAELQCRDDPELRSELLSLLATAERAPAPLEKMAADLLPAAIQNAWGPVTLVGNVVSHYLIEEVIGSGGMGLVYKARDLRLGRRVALKFLRPELCSDERARRRLESEARAASALDHPNIGVVYEIGAADAQLFIAMAYYAGATLRQLIRNGPLSIDEVLHYATQIADAIARAHESDIVHRDIKPANIIVTDRRLAKILDFGLAGSGDVDLSGRGRIFGTIAYMSPEQTLGHGADHRSDQWSFGAMLYEMLTGRRPFGGETDAELIHAIRHEPPAPLAGLRADIPSPLVAIVERCLAKDPRARFLNTQELVAAMRLVTTVKRRWPRVRAASLVATALVSAALVFSWMRKPEPVAVDASLIATIPFTPASMDGELARLGRDLIPPVIKELDGIEGVKFVDGARMLAEVPAGAVLAPEKTQDIARRLGAGRVLSGLLTRGDAGVRLDLSLYRVGAPQPFVRATATTPGPEGLASAAAIAMLDALWQIEPPRAVNLVAVTKSRIPEARRAYLQGELALAQLDMPAALQSFNQAFVLDQSFWWAYWRSLYPRWYRDASEPADPVMLTHILQHRFELPEPDRLLIEAVSSEQRSSQLAKLRSLIGRFPHYSEGWWSLANFLVHFGPYFGTTSEDSRAALERFLALNPGFAAGWDHLVWVAVLQGDSETAQNASTQARRLSQEVATRREWNAVLDLRAHVSVDRRVSPSRLEPAVELMTTSMPHIAEGLTIGFVADGSPLAQLQLNEAARSRASSTSLTIARWRGDALAWAARGNWTQAMQAADRWARASAGAEGKLGAYRLALAGHAWGGMPTGEVPRHRPQPAGSTTWSASERAELAWLDGLYAYLHGDAGRIGTARRAVTGSGGAHAALLDRSLAGLALDLTHGRGPALAQLRSLDSEIVDVHALQKISESHPLLVITHRLYVGRWLRERGSPARAAELLSWHEAIPGPPVLQAWNTSIGSIALLERAEIARSMGDVEKARRYFARFLELYDQPAAGMRPLVQRAAAGLKQLDAS